MTHPGHGWRPVRRGPRDLDGYLVSLAGGGMPWPWISGHGLPGPSAERRLKTMLPGGCSAAWRYHRGKWSRVNMLSSSAGVRNLLQGERPGTSPRSEHGLPYILVLTRSPSPGQGSDSPLPWRRCRQEGLAPRRALSQTTLPGNSRLFQNQMLVHQQAQRRKSRVSA